MPNRAKLLIAVSVMLYGALLVEKTALTYEFSLAEGVCFATVAFLASVGLAALLSRLKLNLAARDSCVRLRLLAVAPLLGSVLVSTGLGVALVVSERTRRDRAEREASQAKEREQRQAAERQQELRAYVKGCAAAAARRVVESFRRAGMSIGDDDNSRLEEFAAILEFDILADPAGRHGRDELEFTRDARRSKEQIAERTTKAERGVIRAIEVGYSFEIESDGSQRAVRLWRGILKNGHRDGLWIGQLGDGCCETREYVNGTETGLRIWWACHFGGGYNYATAMTVESMLDGKRHGYVISNNPMAPYPIEEYDHGVLVRRLNRGDVNELPNSLTAEISRCEDQIKWVLLGEPPRK